MPKKLTPKQRKYIEAYAETGNGTQAALIAYDTTSPKVASVISTENLSKPSIQEALEEALPDTMLLEVHKEGLFATKLSGTGGMRIDMSKEGVESVGHSDLEVPDYAVRHKYLDSAYKLKGSYAAEKHINLNLDAEPTERTEGLAHRLNGLFRR